MGKYILKILSDMKLLTIELIYFAVHKTKTKKLELKKNVPVLQTFHKVKIKS